MAANNSNCILNWARLYNNVESKIDLNSQYDQCFTVPGHSRLGYIHMFTLQLNVSYCVNPNADLRVDKFIVRYMLTLKQKNSLPTTQMISNPFTPEIEFTQVSGLTQNIVPWNSCFFDDISQNPDGSMKTRKCELIYTNPSNVFAYGADHTNIPYFVGHKSISSVVESPPNFSGGALNSSLVQLFLNSLLNEFKSIPNDPSSYCVTPNVDPNSGALSQNVKFANNAESLECQRLRATVAPTSICFRFWYKYELSLGASGSDSNSAGLSCFLAVDFFPNNRMRNRTRLLQISAHNSIQHWQKAEVELDFSGAKSLEILGLCTRTGSATSYSFRYWVDDTALTLPRCNLRETIACSFEGGLCGWSSARERSGRTPGQSLSPTNSSSSELGKWGSLQAQWGAVNEFVARYSSGSGAGHGAGETQFQKVLKNAASSGARLRDHTNAHLRSPLFKPLVYSTVAALFVDSRVFIELASLDKLERFTSPLVNRNTCASFEVYFVKHHFNLPTIAAHSS